MLLKHCSLDWGRVLRKLTRRQTTSLNLFKKSQLSWSQSPALPPQADSICESSSCRDTNISFSFDSPPHPTRESWLEAKPSPRHHKVQTLTDPYKYFQTLRESLKTKRTTPTTQTLVLLCVWWVPNRRCRVAVTSFAERQLSPPQLLRFLLKMALAHPSTDVKPRVKQGSHPPQSITFTPRCPRIPMVAAKTSSWKWSGSIDGLGQVSNLMILKRLNVVK